MDKYEISLWEDYPDLTSNNIPFLNERKICVIGSDTMTSAARAMEPKLVSNVNGTNTFSFKIYYRYKDEVTGEENINPYLPYIINERKVKVLWKGKWYDLVIKKIEEDTQKRFVLCTCEDLFISELSKNGYELEFNSELQNNSGTAEELVDKVLKDSGWQSSEDQQTILQYQEESVYDVICKNNFVASQQPSNKQRTIQAGERCLIYYSCINEDYTNVQFYYAPDSNYIKEKNSMLVTGGDCYTVALCTIEIDDDKESNNFGQVIIKQGLSSQKIIFSFNINNSTNDIEKFSNEYRAKRIVKSQLTAFDKLLGRYVDVYTDGNNNEIYGYTTTEYSDPALVVNLIVNSKDFKDTQGWVGQNLKWEVYPSFTNENNQTITDYVDEAKSYLQVDTSKIYNTALVSNRQYLVPNSTDIKNGFLGGFQKGEKYIFRYKAKSSLDTSEYIKASDYNTYGINCWIQNFTINNSGQYVTNGSSYLVRSLATSITQGSDNWVEITLNCTKVCTANNLDQVGLFIQATKSCYIEDIQFFKLVEGIDPGTGEIKRIDPGEFLLPVSKTIYNYYFADHSYTVGNSEIHIAEDPKDLVLLYSGDIKQGTYTPKYNNYEKVTSIEVSKSNRFNILQTIAEKFECWIRFIINHNEETGQILYDENGLPQKYVQLVEQIGNDTGISFEYGIDLKGVKRTIVSNTIATKAIIVPNENEFGKNGFCTIARSPLNYCRENFILNFDYYVQQGLLNKDLLEADLYKTNEPNLGYYFWLNKYNKEYDELVDTVNMLQIRLTKQQAEYTVQFGNLHAATEKLEDNKSDLMILAGVDNFEDAESYALAHKDNRKVQSLIGSIAKLNNTVKTLAATKNSLESSINALESDIQTRSDIMASLIQDITDLHRNFFKKYSRFIQEGTWQDQNYVDDDKYYLDALEVAYRSSRPQIQYDISLLRLSSLEDFSSKVFDLGDICYIQDKEFFGYEEDGVTPYKQKIIISQLTSFFDTPEKDVIKVQNYKTQFDDLFQRITTAAQALQFSQGRYERAAEVVKPDGTLSFGLLQDTFDYNKDLVINSANQEVTWDNTGITVSDTVNSALKVKIMAGGIFASNDGGITWKNALRGDGISTDLLTAGRINTSEIYVYDGNSPSFRWDSQGINAYTVNSTVDPNTGLTSSEFDFSKFVRFDKFGLYGYDGAEDFEPSTEDAIWYTENPTTHQLEPNFDVRFGLTWRGFFLRNASGNSSIEISTDNDILIKTGDTERIQIGKYNINNIADYGMCIRDEDGNAVFSVSTKNNTNSIGGWTLTSDSFEHSDNEGHTIGLYSDGKSKTVNGIRDTYYILAGDNFGVTIDGGVYASKGKIGDCEIVDGKLTIGSGNTKKNLIDAISTSYSETQYYLSNSENELSSGGSWSSSLPDQADNKYVWTRTAIITTTASGTTSTTYKPSEDGAYSQSLTEMLQGAKASTAVYRTQTIFCSIGPNDSLPTKVTTWVNEKAVNVVNPNNSEQTISSGPQGKWTQIRPIYNSEYPALYIATQTQTIEQYEDREEGAEGTCNCTQPHLEVTTTVIDGAHILTGSIDANKIDVIDLSAFNATIGGFTISDSAIYKTKSSIDAEGVEEGVYIGTNGISLGANFKVTSDGNLYANSGTFAGNVYANNILYGTHQTLSGTTIDCGYIGQNVLAQAVQNSLNYANNYNNATQTNPTDTPAQFTAHTLYATTTTVNGSETGGYVQASRQMTILTGESGWNYSPEFQNTLVPTAAHWHTFTEGTGNDAGKIFIGKAIPATDKYKDQNFFNIANTAYFKAQVLAKETAVGIERIYIDENTLAYTSHNSVDNPDTHLSYTIPASDYSTKTAYSTSAKTLYGVFDLKLSNNKKYFIKIGIPTNNVFDAAVGKPTVTRVYPDPDKDYRESNGRYWIYARGSVKVNGTAKDGDNAELEVTDIYKVGQDYGARTAEVASVSITSNDTHIASGSHHYIRTTVKATAKATLSNNSTYTANEQLITSSRDIIADAVWNAVTLPSNGLSQTQSSYNSHNSSENSNHISFTISNADKTSYSTSKTLYGVFDLTLSNGKTYFMKIGMPTSKVPSSTTTYTITDFTAVATGDPYEEDVTGGDFIETYDYLPISYSFKINGTPIQATPGTVNVSGHMGITGGIYVKDIQRVKRNNDWSQTEDGNVYIFVGKKDGDENSTQKIDITDMVGSGSGSGGISIDDVTRVYPYDSGYYTNTDGSVYTYVGIDEDNFTIVEVTDVWYDGYVTGIESGGGGKIGDTSAAYRMGYEAGMDKTYGSNFERAYNIALGEFRANGFSNALALAKEYQRGYKNGYYGHD